MVRATGWLACLWSTSRETEDPSSTSYSVLSTVPSAGTGKWQIQRARKAGFQPEIGRRHAGIADWAGSTK